MTNMARGPSPRGRCLIPKEPSAALRHNGLHAPLVTGLCNGVLHPPLYRQYWHARWFTTMATV
jgi:hypothetical protein